MEIIKRYIKRNRSNGYVHTFEFTTYDLIFSENMRKGSQDMARLFDFMRLAFECGLPLRDHSPSGMPQLTVNVKQQFCHPLSKFIAKCDYKGAGNRQHMIVQKHLMNHPDFLAMEVPVWDKEASGCIDALFLSKDPFNITVFDFKPNASKEKKAGSQVYRYVKMLVDLTGIHPSNFIGLYGDDLDMFEVQLVNPSTNAHKGKDETNQKNPQ